MHSGQSRNAVGASKRGGNSGGGINGNRGVVTNSGGTRDGEFCGGRFGSNKDSRNGVNGEREEILRGGKVCSESGRKFVEDIVMGVGTAGCANVEAVIGRSIVMIGDPSSGTGSASIIDSSSGTGSASIDDSSSGTSSASIDDVSSGTGSASIDDSSTATGSDSINDSSSGTGNGAYGG